MVPTGQVRQRIAAVKACMTEISRTDENESSKTPAAEAVIPAQGDLRIGVGALLGRLSADATV